jgi:hypothetical protein
MPGAGMKTGLRPCVISPRRSRPLQKIVNRFLTTTVVLAVALQVCNVFAVLAHLATELLAVGADAGTASVSTFSGLCHNPTSLRCADQLIVRGGLVRKRLPGYESASWNSGTKDERKQHKSQPRRGDAIKAQGETLGKWTQIISSPERAIYRIVTTIDSSPFQGSEPYRPRNPGFHPGL